MTENLDDFSSSPTNTSENVWTEVLKIITSSLLPEIKVGNDRPVEENDFIDIKDLIESNFINVHGLLNKTLENEDHGLKKLSKNLRSEIVINLILLCGEHSLTDEPWTTETTVLISKSIIKLLKQFYYCDSILKILIDDKKDGLLFGIFIKLRPKLLKDTWKFYPAAVCSYVRILNEIQTPYLGEILHLVMPTTLILIDDYVPSNRVLGVKCLNHIIINVTKSELSSYCEIEILYKTLNPFLYNHEPEMIQPLINCLVSVINMKLTIDEKLNWTYYDDVMNVLLPLIEMEHKLPLRSAYMDCLPLLIENMGLSCVRWSNRFFRIFEEYAAVAHERDKCFKVMYAFIIATWPRTKHHFSTLVTIILKCILDICDGEDTKTENKNETSKAISNCLNVLHDVDRENMEKLSNEINNDKSLSPSFKQFFNY